MEPTLHSIVQSLRETKGSNAKLDLLRQHAGRDDLKRLMQLIYEPTINYFLTPVKTAMWTLGATGGMQDIEALCETLASRQKTGNAARAAYVETAARLDAGAFDLLVAIFDRDIRAGIAETSVNKIWPDLITIIPYMRCSLPKESKITEWGWGESGFEAYSQIKADGMFANVNVRAGQLEVTSRNGTTFIDGPWFDDIREAAVKTATRISGDAPRQFHGELLVKHKGKVMPREAGNGILNSFLKTGEAPGADYTVVYVAWDTIPLESAVSGGAVAVSYAERYGSLVDGVRAVTTGAFSVVETRVITTYAQAVDHFTEATQRGEEGTVVKHWNCPWEDGTSRFQVKMKVSFQVDLKIVGFNPGNGKNAKTFGSLQCESEDGRLQVGVSGMSDAMRALLNAEREFHTGKIVTVEANAVMSTNGVYSLFLPRLIEVRSDKRVADSIAKILDAFEDARMGRNK